MEGQPKCEDIFLLTAIRSAACVIFSLVTPSGKGVGRQKGVGSCLEGAGKWFEMIPGWAAERKERCFWGRGSLLETKEEL